MNKIIIKIASKSTSGIDTSSPKVKVWGSGNGRGGELAILQNEWASGQSGTLILYGRRRVGKTRLITHWINSTAPRALYWVAEPTSPAGQLRSFSQALFGLESSSPVPEDLFYVSWGQAFEQAARMAKSERFALVLDEFTYLIALEERIAAILQNAWDHHLRPKSWKSVPAALR